MPSHAAEHARRSMKAVAGLLALLACSWLATAQAAQAATPQQTAQAAAAAAATSSSSDPNGQGRLLWLIGKWLSNNDEAVLTAWGWSPTGDPCLGTWQGITCNKRGFVTAIHLAHKGLRGSLPSSLELWAGMKALRDIDVSGNILSGPVPAAISAAGPQLENIDLSGNTELCGGRLAGLPGLVADNTNIDMDCLGLPDNLDPPTAAARAAAAAAQLPALPALPAYAPLAAKGASSAATQPAAASGFVPAASLKQLFEEPAGQPPVSRIGRAEAAPICNCAQNGFGSQECSAAISSACDRAMGAQEHPLCAQAADVGQDVNAAKELATLLAAECFIGQDLETRICGCVQSLMGSECAKARVGLCLKQDPLCLPFQNIINTNSSTSARAVSVVAAVLDKECPIAEPTVQGVKATIEFPELKMDAYISEDYTLNVGNALSSVAAVPSTAVSGLDVRPLASTYASHRASPARSFLMRRGNDPQAAAAPAAAAGPAVIHVTVKQGIRIINPPSSNATSDGSNATSSATNATISTVSGTVKHRRQLLQSAAAAAAAAAAPPGGAGVQATYFIETEDPAAVSHTISAAASEGLLSTRLEQYGVTAPVGGLIIELFMLAPGQKPSGSAPNNPSSSAGGASGTTPAGYALALVAIIAGCVLLCAALGAAGFWCWRRKKAAKCVRLWSLLGGGRRVKPLTSVASVIKTAGAVKVLPEPTGPGVVATIHTVPAAASGTAGGTFQAQLPNADRDALLPRSFDYPAPAPNFAYPPNFSQPDDAAPASFSSAVAAAMAAPAAAMAAAAAGAGSAARSAAAAVAAVAAAASGSSTAAAERRAGPKAAAGAASASAGGGASRASGRAAVSGPVKQQRLATGVSGAPVSLAKTPRPSRTSSSTPRSGATPASPRSSNPSSTCTPKVSLSASTSNEGPPVSNSNRAAAGQRSSVPGAAAAVAAGQRGEGAAGGKPPGRLMGHRDALQGAASKKEPATHVAFGSTVGAAAKTASAPSTRWWA